MLAAFDGYKKECKGIMTTIAARLQAVRSRIAAAAESAGRPLEDIRLIAVSKTFAGTAIQEARAAGQVAFGESYLQEAMTKIPALGPDIEWHHIAPIQSNKTRQVAELFHWAHGVDRLKIAERLSSSRPAGRPPLDICIQVNISGEASKSGVAPQEVLALAQAIFPLQGVRLRGLMAIPEPTPDVSLLRARFRQIRELKDAEGATLVRVGRAIFGERSQGPG